jgi:hypothetical protein
VAASGLAAEELGENGSAPLSARVLALAPFFAATNADTGLGTLSEFGIRNGRLME